MKQAACNKAASSACVVVLLVTGCGGGSDDASSGKRTIDGTVTVGDTGSLSSVFFADGESCYGRGGYSDIKPGTQVVVRDGSGMILGKGALADSSFSKSENGGSCLLQFTVTDIPESDFYAITVGRRGDLTYSSAELAAAGNRVDLSLGI